MKVESDKRYVDYAVQKKMYNIYVTYLRVVNVQLR